MIVSKVILQQPPQMSGMENDHVIQAFPSNGADQPLSIGVLPRTSLCCDDFSYLQRLDAIAKRVAVNGIAVTDEIVFGFAFRNRNRLKRKPSMVPDSFHYVAEKSID